MIEIEDLIPRGVYKLHARNLTAGVWTGSQWIGIREKFGDRFLDSCEVPGRTAHAEEFICMLPDDVEMKMYLPTRCQTCGELVDFDRSRGESAQERWGHTHADHPVRPASQGYQPLFDFFDQLGQ